MEEKGIIIVLGVVVLFAALFAAALNTGYIQSQAVLQDGTTPLTGDWDAGNYTITSDSLTLTGPFGGWEKRIKLSIDSGDVDSDLTDFPVLVYLSTSSGISSDDVSAVFDEVGADYNAIRFTSDDEETDLYYEVELWDEAGEEAWIWVKIPSVASDTDTDLYLYYDSTRDGSAYNSPEDVWDSNFKFVSHMQDDPDTSHVRDSTSNNNDGTKKGANEPIETTGKISKAQDFEADDSHYIDPNEQTLQSIGITATSGYTFEGWTKLESDTSENQGIIESRWNNHKLVATTIGRFAVQCRTDVANILITSTGVDYRDLAWYYVVSRIWIEDGVVHGELYINGIKNGEDTDGTEISSLNAILGIGRKGNEDTHYFDGIIDEPRISNIGRSPSWIKATYESERDDLIEFGNEEIIPILQVDRISEYTDDYGVYIDGVLIKDSDITIALANYLYFRDTEVYISSIDDGHLDLEADTSIDLNSDVVITGGVVVGGNIDMQHNYIIESDFSHWLDFTVEGGKTDETLNLIPSGVCTQDRHYHRLTIGVNTAPGSGKFFNMTLTDGTNELTVSLTNSETSTWTTTGEFDWDASAETLTLHYSQTAGGATTNAFVTIKYHYKENE